MSLWDWFFWWNKGPGTPADQLPHDTRDDESVDADSGIGEADGQLLDNTSIDPATQDKEKGFPT